MHKLITIITTILLVGAVAAKDKYPSIVKIFGAHGEADAQVLIKFYEKEIPGYMKLVEKDLADAATEAEEEPGALEEMQKGIKEELAEFHGEYRELRMEEPEEARNMLAMKRAEVNIDIKAVAVKEARKKKSPAVKKLEDELKSALGHLFDKRLDQLRSELDGIAEEEREEGLDVDGKKEKAYLERMLKLKTQHRKLILEVAFLRAVEGEELFEF